MIVNIVRNVWTILSELIWDRIKHHLESSQEFKNVSQGEKTSLKED